MPYEITVDKPIRGARVLGNISLARCSVKLRNVLSACRPKDTKARFSKPLIDCGHSRSMFVGGFLDGMAHLRNVGASARNRMAAAQKQRSARQNKQN